MDRRDFLKSAASLVALSFFPARAFARSAATTRVCRLGVAPLLGPCWSIEELMRLANANEGLIREAVRQAGHNQEVADRVVEALRLGQVQENVLPDGIILDTMGWYGYNTSGQLGVHTILTPQLALGAPVPCWAFETKVGQKVIVWVLPKRCGNLARFDVRIEAPPPVAPPPPVSVVPPPPPPRFYFPEGKPRSQVALGHQQYLGSTVSGLSLQWQAKPGDVSVAVNQTGSTNNNVNKNINLNENGNNIQVENSNNNVNLNNNSATAQAQNVVPVNVVVNTGDGNAGGAATGTGQQGSSTNQQ